MGHTIIWTTLAAAILLAITPVFTSSSAGPSVVVEVILLTCAVLFWRLTITIDNESLRWSFGIGIIRKQVPLAEIAACESIRIQWLWGWGIHLTPYGWLYNVSGFDAVAITLRNGSQICAGH